MALQKARVVLRYFRKGAHAFIRGLGWLFLFLVVLIVGAAWFLSRTFSTEDARRLAMQQLTNQLHREVLIDHLVLSPRGLKVIGLRIRRGKTGETDLLSCDTAIVTVKLMPLFARRLEFDSVLFQSPQISLTRDAQGDWGLADVFGSSDTHRSATLPLALAAAQTDLEDGVLLIDDQLRRRKFRFDKLRVRIEGFETDGPFPVSTSFRTGMNFAGSSISATVEAAGRVDLAKLSWSNAKATADKLSVDVQGIRLSGNASVAGFTAPTIAAWVTAPSLGPREWQSLIGRPSSVSLPTTHWSLKANLPAPAMLELETLSVVTPAGSLAANGVFDFGADTATLSVELTAKETDIAKVAEWWPPLQAMRLTGKSTGRVSLSGAWDQLQAHDADLSLRRFSGAWDTRHWESVDADLAVSDEFTSLKATVADGKFSWGGNVFEDIVLAINLDKNNLAINRLDLRWGGARARLRARVEHPMAPKEIVLSGTVDRVDWDAAARLIANVRASISSRPVADEGESRPWLRKFRYAIPKGFPDTTGHLHFGEVVQQNFTCKNLELLWTLRGLTPELDKVSGEARLSFGPGRVMDIPAVQNSNKFLSVVFLPFVFMNKMNNLSVFSGNTAYPKSLDFTNIDGEYGVSRGVVTIRYFHVDSPQLAAYTEGTADFAREKVDMNILTRLTSYRSALPEWWVDEIGRPAIGFRVKGDIYKPELEPRFKKIGEAEIEQKVDEGRRRAAKRFQALERLQTQ